jgi:hypothetical protein
MRVGIHHKVLDCPRCGLPVNADHVKGDLYFVQCEADTCGESGIVSEYANIDYLERG